MSIEKIITSLEKIGAIGSPSSTTEISLDILGSAVEKKLVGELAFFKYNQDGHETFALGQITDVELRNAWLEDPTMRSLARQKGSVNPISGQQDTHLGKMTLSAIFANKIPSYEPSLLGTVPQTGTTIYMANDDLLNELLKKYEKEIFYIGNVYGSKPKLPMWFKHFDRGSNGAGEAYHIGIFGKTGSGKSVLAKMILSAYMRYSKMSIIVIDPQGEFSKDFRGIQEDADFSFPLKNIAEKYKKATVTISIKNLVLDRWNLFEEILYESPFFHQLTLPRSDNRRDACAMLLDKLKKASIKLDALHTSNSFDKVWEILTNDSNQQLFYRSPAPRERFNNAIQAADKEEFFNSYWKPVTQLFRPDRDGARKIEAALNWALKIEEGGKLLEKRPLLIIDLSHNDADNVIFWNDNIQSLVIKRVLDGLYNTAEGFYQGGKNLNTLVVIDEAHRLAPRESPESDAEKSVRSVLIDAARTTRKYGLGWLFISQTLSSLHREIISQLRINFFGFGLSMGNEFQSLKEIAGGDANALKLYQSFRDPHSAFDTASKQYSFMTVGPVSPLSFAGTPLFFTSFNTIEAFLENNSIKI